jgi:hypothetical protein
MNLKIKWITLGKRLLFAMAVAGYQAFANGGNTSIHALLVSAAVGLLAATLVATESSGILRPSAPGQASLVGAICAGLIAIATAPASARKAAISQAIADARPFIVAEVKAELEKTGSYQMTPGGLVSLRQAGAPGGNSAGPLASAAPFGDVGAAAIRATGGNQ